MQQRNIPLLENQQYIICQREWAVLTVCITHCKIAFNIFANYTTSRGPHYDLHTMILNLYISINVLTNIAQVYIHDAIVSKQMELNRKGQLN